MGGGPAGVMPMEAFPAAEVMQAFAGKIYRLGDQAGIGSTVKMVNQHLAGVHIATACEAMALGMRAGADPKQLYEVICNSAGMSWMFQNRVPHILEGDYTPLSAVNIFVKDLGLVVDAAKAQTYPAPIANAAYLRFLATTAKGLGKLDDSAVMRSWLMRLVLSGQWRASPESAFTCCSKAKRGSSSSGCGSR